MLPEEIDCVGLPLEEAAKAGEPVPGGTLFNVGVVIDRRADVIVHPTMWRDYTGWPYASGSNMIPLQPESFATRASTPLHEGDSDFRPSELVLGLSVGGVRLVGFDLQSSVFSVQLSVLGPGRGRVAVLTDNSPLMYTYTVRQLGQNAVPQAGIFW